MTSFVELPWIIFLFCQLNSRNSEVTEGEKEPRIGHYFNCLTKSKIQRTFTRGYFGGKIGNFSSESFLLKVMGIKIYRLTLDQL